MAKSSNRSSLAIKVGLLYFVMNVISISLFTYVITNNQVELISDNTRFQAKELIESVVQNLRRMPAIPSSERGWTEADRKRMQMEISAILDQFANSHGIFRKDTILARSLNLVDLPEGHVENAAKASTLREFSGADFHLLVMREQEEIHFYLPLDEFGLAESTAFVSLNMLEVGRRFRDLYQLIAISVVALTLLHILFAYLIYRMILTPVIALYSATQKVAAGDYQHQVRVNRRDEIGALAEGFNSMVEVIRDTITSLHQRMAELRKAKGQIERMAVTDELTGLYNRRYLYESLEKQVASSRRYNKNLGILLIDVDNFKRVNDSFGHQAGDLVLRQIATRIQKACRDSDLVARYGGEELMVLLPETDSEQTLAVAQKIRTVVEAQPAQLENGKPLRITVSIGVSEARMLSGILGRETTVGLLVEAADTALYRAKNNGRNRVEIIQEPWK